MTLTMDIPALVAAVVSIDLLNSHERSGYIAASLKSQIYCLKDRTVRMLDEAGLVSARTIAVRVKCQRCGGSGVWNERTGSICYGCNGDKTLQLFFREYRIGRSLLCQDWPAETDIVWHRPISSRDADPRLIEIETAWKPRQKGVALAADELAAALNHAESTLPPRGLAERYPLYWLHVGNYGVTCSVCGGAVERDGHTWGIERGCVSWTAGVCEPCEGHLKQISRSRYGGHWVDRLRIPWPLLPAAITEWINRRGGVGRVLRAEVEGWR